MLFRSGLIEENEKQKQLLEIDQQLERIKLETLEKHPASEWARIIQETMADILEQHEERTAGKNGK